MPKVDPAIFKAYDIRGIYPTQLDEEIAYLIGKALVEYLKPKNIAVGLDMRLSSPFLLENLTRGILEAGSSVVDIGLCSTDELYFAVGKFGYDGGVMITASHNPKEYNGFKICQKEAVPLSGDKGLKEIQQIITSERFSTVTKKGNLIKKNVSADYIQHILSFVDVKKIKPFKIVVDAGNGMAGLLIPKLFAHLPGQLIPLFFELDGSFPNHPASPIEPENLRFLQEKVLEEKAFLGAAFDGDADRVFIVDEKANILGGDIVTALVAKNLLKKEKNATILYNLICSRTVPKIIEANGGKTIKTRVGHALIKPLMKQYKAIFGGEHSGHFYYRDNFYADSALITLVVFLELSSEENKNVSELVKEIDQYYRSGEINSKVEDIPKKLQEIEKLYSKGKIDHLDGLTVEFENWWFNLRPSNTEPLLRLNVEADSKELLKQKTLELLNLIRS
ncbi:MAG: phosphomannomutase/phosphoglucomutase [candidate division Zixibacteria bacterium RBG_16_40_9]|nr:MAG: phosphomannomutase/phosphoglucomutase [candidate division Zixibacteria bacterium RBG_16_40_9]